ncbi:MAG: metallophosphoesterase family protein [Spirochaetaceae bacterium]|nr:metallophosphoesterase family protein [Spirochaetaceae bacterium]
MLKVLILSDIHGNFDALEAVMTHAGGFSWQEIWFLGDLGGYGPEVDKCFHVLQSHSTLFLPGNHDLYYSGRLSRGFFSKEARKALILSRDTIKKEYFDTMKVLPVFRKKKGVSMVHGSLIDPERDYILHEEDALQNFKLLKGQCCLFGHTHRQGCYLKEKDKLFWIRPEDNEVVQYRRKKILINPGSVGQPRDHDPRAAWAILDTKAKEVQFFRTEYNIQSVQRKMEALGSSEFLIRRLESGM